MRIDERKLLDDLLVSEEACLGAVFCSYTFDPAFFEEHVLRAALRLRGDPEEDAASYQEEARAALRDIPIVCFVDAAARTPGRRLPYDLCLVRRRTFHPKVYVLLYESGARLAVGSGNLTKAGIEQNTELFFVRRLAYEEPADAALLRAVDRFLGQCAELADTPSSQLALVRDALRARVEGTPERGPKSAPDVQFVSSFEGALLDVLADAMPEDAKVRRVGVLAPFFELDDAAALSGDGGVDSVLARLLELRPSSAAPVDIAVPWDDAPLAPPPAAKPPRVEDGLGSLWAWRAKRPARGDGAGARTGSGAGGGAGGGGGGGGGPEEDADMPESARKRERAIRYLTLVSATAKRIEARGARGESARYDRADLELAIDTRRAWPVARPTVFAPKAILTRLAETRDISLWLHPTAELGPTGKPRRRSLHAKVILLTFERRAKTSTLALIGSANASRMALERSVEKGANVEAGILCRFDGEVRLHDVLPSLVLHDLARVQLTERTMATPALDMSAWIEDAVHDAAARTLVVSWREEGPAPLGEWTLLYGQRELARGSGPPGDRATRVDDFELDAATAEVTLRTGGAEWFVPIRVLDLSALPVAPGLAALGLRELLALLGRRITSERLTITRATRGPAGITAFLDAVFGEGFGPTDVFKAWWGVVDDLAAAHTVLAFRHRLRGTTGVATAWKQLRAVSANELSQDEVWVYGCELRRELQALAIPEGPDADAKRDLVQAFLDELHADLAAMTPSDPNIPWLVDVSKFYGLEAARDRS